MIIFYKCHNKAIDNYQNDEYWFKAKIIGAINIDIRQYGYHRNSNDDTYIALRDIDTGEYILNGDFVMSMFRKTIQYGGTTLEYSV